MYNFLLNIALRNPLGVLLAHYLVADALGADILGSIAIFTIDSKYAGIFAAQGAYGDFNGFADIWVLLQRIFRLSFLFTIIPFTIILFLCWSAICLRNQRLVWRLNNRQRWLIVILMQALPLLYVLFELSRFSQMALFAGPIHGFHPLTPLSVSFFELSTPLLFWLIISRLNHDIPHTSDAEKGN